MSKEQEEPQVDLYRTLPEEELKRFASTTPERIVQAMLEARVQVGNDEARAIVVAPNLLFR